MLRPGSRSHSLLMILSALLVSFVMTACGGGESDSDVEPDLLEPAIGISEPTPGYIYTSSRLVTVSGLADGTGSALTLIEIQINTGELNAATGTASWAYSFIRGSDSSRTDITVYATDSGANVATETTWFAMDVSPPGSIISSPSDNDEFTTNVIPVSGTAWDPNRGYSISEIEICYHTGGGCLAWTSVFDSFSAGSWSGTVTVPGVGSYTIESRATDLSGHLEETPDAVNITVVDPG